MKENLLLRAIADRAEYPIEFKDEKILPGTCWINSLPVDIEIVGADIVLNSVGKFQGDAKAYSKCEFRGKGLFFDLRLHFKHVMIENEYEPVLWLLPLSPVWEKYYNLTQHEKSVKGCHFTIGL